MNFSVGRVYLPDVIKRIMNETIFLKISNYIFFNIQIKPCAIFIIMRKWDNKSIMFTTLVQLFPDQKDLLKIIRIRKERVHKELKKKETMINNYTFEVPVV